MIIAVVAFIPNEKGISIATPATGPMPGARHQCSRQDTEKAVCEIDRLQSDGKAGQESGDYLHSGTVLTEVIHG